MLRKDVASLLRKYAIARNLVEGKGLHSRLKRDGHDRKTFVGNLLLNMYGNCGSLQDARMVFDQIRERNVFTWNIMITAYAQNGHLQEARDAFDRMPKQNVVSWNTMVSSYAQNTNAQDARALFDRMPDHDIFSWNSMLGAYARNGDLEEARRVFESMEEWDALSFNAMISAYAQKGHTKGARRLFEQMLDRNLVSWNLIVAAFARAGQLGEARSMFERMPETDVVAWTEMFQAYAQHGHIQEAKAMFDTMPQRDVVSWTGMFRAYAKKGHLQEARNVFNKMAEQDEVSWTAMVTECGERGGLDEARIVFDGMPERNTVSWTAMITAYARHGHGKAALELFRLMDLEGAGIDQITVVSILDACASIPALAEGRMIHAEIIEKGLDSNVAVSTAIVNMYAKCGSLSYARNLFHAMPQRDVVSWNSLIAAYSRSSGEGTEALSLYRLMILDGMQPYDSSFVSVLCACSHAGLLEGARQHLISMSMDFGLAPTFELYMVMVDLLARAGRLDRAEELMSSMPFEPDVVSWRTLLGACRVQGDAERGSSVAGNVIRLDQEHPASYVLLSNLYASGDGMPLTASFIGFDDSVKMRSAKVD